MKFTKKALASQVNSMRPYKSRSKRPCDFCRRRKTCCIIENSIPCLACVQFNKGNCTFVNGPLKRNRPKTKNGKPISYHDDKEDGKPKKVPTNPPSEPSHAQPSEPHNTHQHELSHDHQTTDQQKSSLSSLGVRMDYSMTQSFQAPPLCPTDPNHHSHVMPSPHLSLSNHTSSPQSSPHTPAAYSFHSNWSSGESAGGTTLQPQQSFHSLPSDSSRQSMSSNSSSLSNMSMGYTYPYAMSGGFFADSLANTTSMSGAHAGSYEPTLWTDAGEYEELVTMEVVPEEMKKEYNNGQLGPGVLGASSLAGPVQALGLDTGSSYEATAAGDYVGYGDSLVGPTTME
ncbi:hypothetical protein ACI3LY_000262 [Candidozyma auris]|uniref:Zn(2)-C6 fungal-type domain-containing protein n=2 Tax=Candidozyma auris TaxID=498019 RepID=A0AB36WBE3_CANAR|nr:hypothetical protein QG37_01666 [[Candida] auris]PIS57742.1 hypothetical protein CJI97_000792 [[Candida] auris]PIS58297.1 hypothetical protein B9J08_000791 [[Candida] auris]QWW23554.1 hypothetical protein CA7LBN_002355 [[Candida] auris]